MKPTTNERRHRLVRDVSDKTWARIAKQAKLRGMKIGFYLDELVK